MDENAGSTPPPLPPGVAQVLDVPAQPTEGGEWELLLAKLQAWWSSGEPQALWQRLSKPLGGGVGLLLLLLVLQLYGAVIGTLESLPLLPGLLELTGLLWLLRQGLPRLLRSRERAQLLADLGNRWKAFRAQS